jgi:surface polysaccharide O-acyltransferase-like enzyme
MISGAFLIEKAQQESLGQFFSRRFRRMVMAVCIFILVKSSIFDWNNNHWSSSLITMLAACVPGIYFVHALVLALLKRGWLGSTLDEAIYGPAFGIPLFALASFVFSLIIVIPIRLIPIVRCIVP